MKFISEHYPGLVVHDLGVTFVDGEAEVDTKTAAELRKLPPELGVREAGKTDRTGASTRDRSGKDEA